MVSKGHRQRERGRQSLRAAVGGQRRVVMQQFCRAVMAEVQVDGSLRIRGPAWSVSLEWVGYGHRGQEKLLKPNRNRKLEVHCCGDLSGQGLE